MRLTKTEPDVKLPETDEDEVRVDLSSPRQTATEADEALDREALRAVIDELALEAGGWGVTGPECWRQYIKATGKKEEDVRLQTIATRLSEYCKTLEYRNTGETRKGQRKNVVYVRTDKLAWLRQQPEYAEKFKVFDAHTGEKAEILKALKAKNAEIFADIKTVAIWAKEILGPEWEYEYLTGDLYEMLTPEQWRNQGE